MFMYVWVIFTGIFLDRSPPLLSPPAVEITADSTEIRLNGSSPPRGGKRICRENVDEGKKGIISRQIFLP